MVVVRFLIEFSDSITVNVTVGITDTRTAAGHPPLVNYVARLREKCHIKSYVELRYKDGSKVDPKEWVPEKKDGEFLLGIVNEPASEAALQYRENMCRSIRANSQIGKQPPPPPSSSLKMVGGDNDDSVVRIDPSQKGGAASGSSRVDILPDDDENNSGGAAAAAAAAAADADGHKPQQPAAQQQSPPTATLDDSDDDDDYDPRGGEWVSAEDAVHYIAHHQRGIETGNTTSVSRVAGSFGNVLFTEPPQLAPMYPSSLVDLVRRDGRLQNWLRQLDPEAAKVGGRNVEKVESQLFGVSAEEYSQLLYVAKRRGHILPANKDQECEVAFYSVTDTIMHSCAPSAFVRYKRIKKEQKKDSEKKKDDEEEQGGDGEECAAKKADETEQIAVVRCARHSGITAGEMLSVALPRVAFMDFFLLPTARRRRFIQEQYLVKGECPCERCTGRVGEAQSTLEVSLTGAFFEGSPSSREQTLLTVQMKKEFDDLKIMAPSAGAHNPSKKQQQHEPLVLSIDARAGKIPAANVQKLYDFVVKYTHDLHLPAHLQSKQQDASSVNNSDKKEAETETTAAAAANGDQEKSRLLLHPQHWRLNMVRIALLAFLFPPKRCKKAPRIAPAADRKADIAGLPLKHSSVKLDQLVVRMALTQLEVESAAMAKSAGSAHPVLRRSYIVLRYILALLPDKLAADVQIQARSLPSVDWTMLEEISKM